MHCKVIRMAETVHLTAASQTAFNNEKYDMLLLWWSTYKIITLTVVSANFWSCSKIFCGLSSMKRACVCTHTHTFLSHTHISLCEISSKVGGFACVGNKADALYTHDL